jgi:tetratricopeptide (TPR) repeat protein
MNEHNPIAFELNKIQHAWLKEVAKNPQLRVVRLVIKPEEARVYEGFCKLESSPHGQMPEVFVTHLTNFEDEDTFSADIIKDWLETFDNSAALMEELQKRNVAFTWNPKVYQQALEHGNGQPLDDTLLRMLNDFKQALPREEADKQLVLALLPRQVSHMRGLKNWLTNMLKKGIPAGVKLLMFDHVGDEQLAIHERLFPGQMHSMHVPLELQNAIQKLAKSGNPNDPEIALRRCMFEMGDALKAKDIKRLHEWGQKALDYTQKSGNKGLFATAHIMYAGMLFYFKRDPQLPVLLERGMRISKQGMQQGDVACLPLMVQFYGYHGAYAQIRRNFDEAIEWFIKQAKLAQEHQFNQQAMNGWYQAAELCRRKNTGRYYMVLEEAYLAGLSLQDEEISTSVYIYLLRDYYDYVHNKKIQDTIQKIDEKMGRLFGNNWKEEVDRIRKTRAPLMMPPQTMDMEEA